MVEKTDLCVFLHFYLWEVLDFWIEGIFWRELKGRFYVRLDKAAFCQIGSSQV